MTGRQGDNVKDNLTQILLSDPLLAAARAIGAERGRRVWLVGGAVRDLWRGVPVRDWDVAVERGAITLARAIADRLRADVYVLDVEHDTARVLTADAHLDIAGLRGRSLEADLKDRDFTVNALAIDLDQPDRLIDLVGGERDLADGVIRALGEQALTGDPIRLLRAVRQAIGLNFEIDLQTARWIAQHAALITTASAERVRDELIKLIGEAGCADSLLLLDAYGLLGHILPEVAALQNVTQSPPHHWDVYEHTRRVVDALEMIGARLLGFEQSDDTAIMQPVIPDWVWSSLLLTLSPFADALRTQLREFEIDAARSRWHTLKWTALLHDIGKPGTRSVDEDGRIRFFGHEDLSAQLADERLRALKFSSAEIDRVRGVIGGHMRPHWLAQSALTPRAIYRFFRATRDYGVDILLLSLADHLATHGPDVERERWAKRLELIQAMLAAYFERRAEVVAPLPLINGTELMAALNLRPGRQIGVLLEAIREAQAAGEVTTKEEAVRLAREVMSER